MKAMPSKLDLKPDKSVSERMKRVKAKGTKIELAMKEILKELGVHYMSHPKMFGSPDFRIKNTNVLIFCDSSFWHGRRPNELSGKAFKKNRAFWVKKLNDNKKRDLRNNDRLRRYGWSVHRFWDTDIINKTDKVRKRIKRIIKISGKRKFGAMADGN